MNDNTKGIVYLIGAGPGDPDLITVRGLSLLHSADVVIYDNLVPDELIITLPAHIEKIYVGKKAGKHTLPQSEINAFMVKLAGEGKTIARLKGGDPFIFGRGGEEARYLVEHGIDFEIVPGVTAASAGTAYAGIPTTDRDLSSFLVLATGHKADSKERSPVPWEWLADSRGGTIVIYMGVAEFANIVSLLIDHGMPQDTPAAAIERGTFPTQRVITAPLNELVVRAIEEKIKPPALFVIGKVVDLRAYLNWFEKKLLFGHRIMVLRPADQAVDMYHKLRQLGAEVLPYPTIATRAASDESSWEKLNNIINNKNDNLWLTLTSENGVRYFIEQFKIKIGDISQLRHFKIAAVGYGTARALSKYSLTADFLPSKATTESLARELAAKHDLSNSIIIRVRGNLADNRVEDILTETGATVIPLRTYETYHPEWPDGFKEKLFDYLPNIIIFTSGSTVDGLFKMLTHEEIDELTADADIISIGPMTSEIIRSHGLKVKHEAIEHSVPGIIEEIKRHYQRNK